LQSGQLRRLLVEDGCHQRAPVDRIERLQAGEHLEQHHAECEHVCPGVRLAAFDLFRRHVLERTEHAARHREIGRHRHHVGGGLHAILRSGGGVLLFGDAEIEQLRRGQRGQPATRNEEDVSRFEIAMDDARVMRAVECRCDLNGVLNRLLDRNCAARQPRCERLALEQFHHEIPDCDRLVKADPCVVRGDRGFADIVKHANVWMVQGCNCAGFAIEPLARLRVVGDV
jgi:hypothetical protein